MPVVFEEPPIRPSSYTALDSQATLGEYAAANAKEAWQGNPVVLGYDSMKQSAWRMIEGDPHQRSPETYVPEPDTMTGFVDQAPATEEPSQLRNGFMSPEDATARAKNDLGTDVRFERPVSEREFQTRVKRKQDDEARELIYQTAPKGVTTATVGFLTNLAVSAIDPINVGSAFIPFVREARFAQWAARFGTTGARFAKGAVEGAAGAALLEPGILAGHEYLGDDYTLKDSLTNVVVGGALGGGLHFAAGKISDYFDRKVTGDTPTILESVGPAQRSNMLSAATQSTLNGYMPQMDHFAAAIGLDVMARPFSRDVVELALSQDARRFAADIGNQKLVRVANDYLANLTKEYFPDDTKIGAGDRNYDLQRMYEMFQNKYRDLEGIDFRVAVDNADFDNAAKSAGVQYAPADRPATFFDANRGEIVVQSKAPMWLARLEVENQLDRLAGREEGGLRYDRDDFLGQYLHRQIQQASFREVRTDAQGRPVTGESSLRGFVNATESKPLLDGTTQQQARDQRLESMSEEAELDAIQRGEIEAITETFVKMADDPNLTRGKAAMLGEFKDQMAQAGEKISTAREEAKAFRAFAECMKRG